MLKHYFTILFLCLWSIAGCQTDQANVPIEKDGKLYGITQGLFRHRWWNYYERGTSYSDGEFWKEAEADFRAALSQSDNDQRRKRTYGMHFADYFPHRELGVALFHQKHYKEAIQELETSLSDEVSAKAQFYLDKARKARIEQENSDTEPPAVLIESPEENALSGNFTLTVKGIATDDTFVKAIRINGKPIRIDLSAPEIAFHTEIPIKTGKNSVVIEAKDLTGKSGRITRTVMCDRAGPVLNIDDLIKSDQSDKGGFILRGYAYDDSGIKEIRVNHQNILKTAVPQVVLNHEIFLSSESEKAVVVAEDTAGNQTVAEVYPHVSRSESFWIPDKNEKILNDFFIFSGMTCGRIPYFKTGITPDFYESSVSVIPVEIEKSLKDFSISNRNPEIFDLLHLSFSFVPKPELGNESNDSKLLFASLDSFPYYAQRGRIISAERIEGMLKHYNKSGKNYALITGINDYDEWPVLKTAVNDADELRNILVRKYRFSQENVILRTDKDATLSNMTQDLRKMAAGLGENDNLLIYFAGHGQLDNLTNDGYWIPVEGKLKDPTTWMTNSVIKNILSSENVRGKNIVVIADSCYSGTLLRGGMSPLSASEQNYKAKILQLAFKKSRQIITSGGTEPVADRGRDGHSLFAYYFLKSLEENTYEVMDIENLFIANVWKSVSEKGGQRPVIGRLKTPMDEDGQFVLVMKSESSEEQTEEASSDIQEQPVKKQEIVPDVRLADTQPPDVNIRDWKESQTVYADMVYIEGSAKDDYGIQSLTVNNEKVLKRPGRNVYFNYTAELKQGDNAFKIECADSVGNKAEKHINIHRKLQKVYETGSRMAVAVFPFEQKGEQKIEAEDVFLAYLIESERFKIKEDILKNRMTEQEWDIEKAKAVAEKLQADAILMGKVSAKENAVEISARMIDADNLEILTQKDVYDEGTDRELIQSLCQGLVLKLRDEFPLVEGIVVQVQDNRIYTDIGRNTGVKSGMKLIVFQKGEPVIHPVTGKILSAGIVRELAEARIESVADEMSVGVLNRIENNTAIEPMYQVITR